MLSATEKREIAALSKEHHVAEEEIKSLLETFWVFDSNGKITSNKTSFRW
jgi:hypothetical protein